MHVTAETREKAADERAGNKTNKESFESLAKSHYYCPVYKYKARTDKYLIFRCYLKAEGSESNKQSFPKPLINWKLKGVALLCSKE